jgi:hypothetical protein
MVEENQNLADFENNPQIRYSIQHVVKELTKRYPVLESSLANHPFRQISENINGFSFILWDGMPGKKYQNLLIKKSFGLVGIRIISERQEDGTFELKITNHKCSFIFIPIPNSVISFFSKTYIEDIQSYLENKLGVNIKKIDKKDADSMWPDDFRWE